MFCINKPKVKCSRVFQTGQVTKSVQEREQKQERQERVGRQKKDRVQKTVDDKERLGYSQKHRGPGKAQKQNVRFGFHLRGPAPSEHIDDLGGSKHDRDSDDDFQGPLPGDSPHEGGETEANNSQDCDIAGGTAGDVADDGF